MRTKFAKLRLILLIPVALWLVSCSGATKPAGDEAEAAPGADVVEPAVEAPPSGDPYATLQTSEGDIVIRLRPDLAPRTVENFIDLARKNFYYGTRVHRIIPGTIIQAGDPNSKDNNPYNDGQGNSGTFLPAEFSKEPFRRGSVAMARNPGDPDSASCQFFVVLKRMSQWDGEYTLFGEVSEGIEVVEKMARSATSKDPQLKEHPTANFTIRRVLIEYRPPDQSD